MSNCSSIESIGGKVVCLIDHQFLMFLGKFLTTQSDTFVSFGNLIVILFIFILIGSIVVFAFKIPIAMSKLYTSLLIVLVCGLTINPTFIFGFLNFFDGIALEISKSFFKIANPDIEVNYYWDLYAGLDMMMRNIWALTRITWNVSHIFWGDLGWLDFGLALLLSVFCGILYLTFSAFLLIAIAGKYIFACLFPFVALASILPISRYIFAPYIKQLLSFILMVAMLSLMMGITTATFDSLNDSSSSRIFGQSSLLEKYTALETKLANIPADAKKDYCPGPGKSGCMPLEERNINSQIEVLTEQIKDILKDLFTSSVFWSILFVLWIAIFYHLKSSDWISLIIGSQAVQGMGAFITATTGAAGGAMAAGRMAQSPLNAGSQAFHASKNDFAKQSPSSMAIRSVRSTITSVRSILGKG